MEVTTKGIIQIELGSNYMKITQRLQNAVNGFVANRMTGTPLGKQFLKYGNRRALIQDWSQVQMSDQEKYKGYPYAMVTKRSKAVARLGTSNIKTSASQKISDEAKKKDEVIKHPYLEIIDRSVSFSNYKFWRDISTYIDLVGVYYLMAVREATIEDGHVTTSSEIEYFKLLNPYNIKRVVNADGELGGYIENKNGLIREIPIYMIIEMRELNPFDNVEPYAMMDAAKEAQFTLKQAADYTRHSIKNNMGAPGIIGTDIILPDEMFQNFQDRIINQEKGVPLFGNGAGAITWQDMQIDLNKAALDKVSEVNRDELFAAGGVSKTAMGIEQSGTTRDTSQVQKDAFTEDTAIPQLQLIIDALNQDYKIYYPDEYEENEYTLFIDNPLESTVDTEIKDTDLRTKQYELFTTLVNKGYDKQVAAQYANGSKSLADIGEPTNDPIEDPIQAIPVTQAVSQQAHVCDDDCGHLDIIHNQMDDETTGIITQQQGTLQSAIVNIEQQLTAEVINKVSKVKNAFEKESDIISESSKNDFKRELEVVLGGFYTVIIPLYAGMTMNRRLKEFAKQGVFQFNTEVKGWIKATSKRAAESHINTIVDDLYKTVQEGALQGASETKLVSMITDKYSTVVTQTRAKTIARTETNRAFTRSQYEADKQFIKQNDLEGRVYKQFITRSNNPCPICQSLAKEPPVPFDKNFADLGDELTAVYKDGDKTKVLKQTIGFEPVQAGNVHPNCSCAYRLIIE